jgi:hypothetical protein
MHVPVGQSGGGQRPLSSVKAKWSEACPDASVCEEMEGTAVQR